MEPNCRKNYLAGFFLFRVILFGCSLCAGQSLYAQTDQLDSLIKIAGEASGNERVNLFHQVAYHLLNYDADESLRYGQQAYEIARGQRDIGGMARSLTDIGQYYYFTGDYSTAREFYQQAVEITGALDYGDYPAYTWTCIGNTFRDQGSFDTARMYYEKSLSLLSGKKDYSVSRSSAYFNLGSLYERFSLYDKAKSYFHQALALYAKEKDSLQMAFCWNSLGSIATATFDLDSSEIYFNALHGVLERHNNNLLNLLYFSNYGYLAYTQGAYDEAINLYSKALELMRRDEYRQYYAVILKRIGEIFRIEGDFNRALEQFLGALQLNERLGNIQEMAYVNSLIGWLYLNQQNDSLAMEFANKSLAQANRIHDDAGVANNYNLIGHVYYNRKDFNKALDYFNKALQIRRELKLGNLVCSTLLNMAKVYYDEGLIMKAMEYNEKIINLNPDKIDKRLLSMVYNSMTKIYISQKNYQQAKAYLDKGQDIAMKVRLPIQLRDNYKLYAEIELKQGNYKSAAEFYRSYIELNDTLFNSEAVNKIAQLNAVYQLANKENEIRLLSQENEIKQSQIEVQESRLKLQRNILISAIVVSVLFAGLTYVLFLYTRAKQKANKELAVLNRNISEKNEEIQAQAEELIEANSTLTSLNNRLIESQEEVQAQSEELAEANEIIMNVNKGLEQKILERTDQLKQAYIELDTFFYRSSHDFRRPLTTFLGLAEVAKITVKNANALELFEKVRETALNLDKMLVKLQSISDVGTQQLVYKQVLLKELIISVMDNFRHELDTRGVKFHLDIDLNGEFYSYPVLVKIIVENLIENAINFSCKNNPYIKVRAHEKNNNVTLEIIDNGQGISDELTGRIFDMYFRANHNSKGNGLGLYIVKKAVEKIYGNITFSSKLDQGSVFTVTIPFKAQSV